MTGVRFLLILGMLCVHSFSMAIPCALIFDSKILKNLKVGKKTQAFKLTQKNLSLMSGAQNAKEGRPPGTADILPSAEPEASLSKSESSEPELKQNLTLQEEKETSIKETDSSPDQGSKVGPASSENPEDANASKDDDDPDVLLDEDDRRITIHHAEYIFREGDEIHARNDVRFTFRGYDVAAQEVDGNLKTEEFILKGNVIVFGFEQTYTCDQVTINFKTRTFRYLGGFSELGPNFLGGDFEDYLYIRSLSGGGQKEEVEASFALTTSCSKKCPHYSINSRLVNIRPGKRALFRDVDLFILGHKIFHLPYLIVPLEEDADRYIPEVGYNSFEGYYIKTRWGVPLRGESFVDLRLDYFSQVGFGVGADLNYYEKDHNKTSQAMAYTVPSTVKKGDPVSGEEGEGHEQGYIFSLSHSQDLGTTKFSTEFEYIDRDRYTSPNNLAIRSKSSLEIPQKNATTRLSHSNYLNKELVPKRVVVNQNPFRYLSDSYILNDRRRWTKRTSTVLDLNFNQNTRLQESTGQSFFEKFLDVDFRLNHEMEHLTAELDYIHKVPVNVDESSFIRSAADRTPEFIFRTDANRLYGKKHSALAKDFPFRISTAAGNYFDRMGIQDLDITRYLIDFNTSRSYQSGRGTLSWNANYKQTFYSDKTAQYTIDLQPKYVYKFFEDANFNIQYDYKGFDGFTPLSFDRTNKRNNLFSEISYRPFSDWLFGIQGGYDFLMAEKQREATTPEERSRFEPWRPVYLHVKYTPSDVFQIVSRARYDTLLRAWTSVSTLMDWDIMGGHVGAVVSHDSKAKIEGSSSAYRLELGHVGFLAEGLISKKMKTSLLLNYNHSLKRVTEKQLALVYDLHCMEAIFFVSDRNVGFRSGIEFGGYIRLKAVPYKIPFGAGSFGEPIGLSLGY